MKKLSAIILSYNTKELLHQSINSIYKHLPQELFEIIVVDNASSDGSSEMVKKNFPHVKLIQSEENLGFSKGINLGAKSAKGQYLFFFNSDAQLRDDKVKEMISYLESRKDIGIMGGMLINKDGTMQRSFGRFYTLPAACLMLIGGDKAELIGNYSKKEKPVDWVSGGFMVVQRELFEKLKGFDEHFFMYIEDMELCYRANKVGYKTYAYLEAVAVHAKEGSSNRGFAIEHIYKGLLYFYKKHRNPIEYLILKFLLGMKALLLLVVGILKKDKYLETTYKKALNT